MPSIQPSYSLHLDDDVGAVLTVFVQGTRRATQAMSQYDKTLRQATAKPVLAATSHRATMQSLQQIANLSTPQAKITKYGTRYVENRTESDVSESISGSLLWTILRFLAKRLLSLVAKAVIKIAEKIISWTKTIWAEVIVPFSETIKEKINS